MNTTKTTRSYPVVLGHRATKGQPKTININYLQDISAGDDTFIGVLLRSFQSETRRCLGQLKNQLLSGDFTQVEKIAHSMKPSGVYIGANSFTVLVTQLEHAAHDAKKSEVKNLIQEIQKMADMILNEIDHYLLHHGQ